MSMFHNMFLNCAVIFRDSIYHTILLYYIKCDNAFANILNYLDTLNGSTSLSRPPLGFTFPKFVQDNHDSFFLDRCIK